MTRKDDFADKIGHGAAVGPGIPMVSRSGKRKAASCTSRLCQHLDFALLGSIAMKIHFWYLKELSLRQFIIASL